MSIGAVLKMYRDEHDMTQDELATNNGAKLKRQTISEAERHNFYNPGPEKLMQLC